MSSKWEYVKLGDIVDVASSKRVFRKDYVENGIPFFRSKEIIEISEGRSPTTELYISEEKFTELEKNGYPKSGDILITAVGTLGRILIIPQNLGRFYFKDGNLAWLRNFDEKLNRGYLYYCLISSKVQADLNKIAIGTTQRALTLVNLKKLTIPLPNLSIQNKIAKILGNLDKKIILNNQINETLEAMAQALFKSWFIDFEPVKAKIEARDAGQDAEGILLASMSAISGKEIKELKVLQTTAPEEYAELKAIAEQFPDSLEESELGMIPKGWEVVIAEDLYEITIGRTPPRKEKQWFSLNDHDIKWLSIKDLGQNGIYIMQTNEKLTYEAIEKFRINVLPQNTVFLSFKMTIGRVGIANERMCTNEAIAHFVPLDEIPYEWTYLYLTHFNYDSLGSTSSIATAINSKIIRQMRLLMPTSNLLEIFRLKISYIFQKIRSIGIENQTLTELRDTLLPKLLSGEIDVSNVEIDELLENEA